MRTQALRARLQADAPLPAAKRSFLLRPRGRSRGSVLLIHGFSACPYEVHDCARFLQAHGYLCYAPRLAGHGAGTAAFNAKGRADWLADAERALLDLQAPGAAINVIGHSMGGILATLCAARHPQAVRRLVLAAPAFRLADPLAPLCTLSLVRALIPALHFKPQHPDAANWTLDYASRCVSELVHLGREGAAAAKQLQVPLFLLQSRVDPLVSRPFNERLFPQVPSQPKALWIYDAAEHNVLHRYNPRQSEAFQRILSFLR